jgi:hypothetical protein
MHLRRRSFIKYASFAAVGNLAASSCVLDITAQTTTPVIGEADQLASGFANPPNSARPRVWWHWMNGNITIDGIDLDLEWMKRIGLGGFHIFDIAMNTPTIVDKRLIYMTPEWKIAFQHALTKAEAMGFEVTIASSPGWSETGGPWVTPSEAMKKLVWSETEIVGGHLFQGPITPPPQVAGYFQDLGSVSRGQFYADVAVFAYPIREEANAIPRITTSAGKSLTDHESKALSDGVLSKAALILPVAPVGEDSWIQFEYGQVQTIQAVALATLDDGPAKFAQNQIAATRIESSEDGITFQQIAMMPSDSTIQHTTSFIPTKARFFRVTFRSLKTVDSAARYRIAELKLHAEPRSNEFEQKAGFAIAKNYYAIATPDIAAGTAVPTEAVIDLKNNMSADGMLTWTPPPGRWRIIRMGCSLTGRRNGPAPPEATGFEVDKLSRPYVQAYLERYLSSYSDFIGKQQMGSHGIRYMLTDSTEAKTQNWTDDMLEQFQSRRGYDPRPWLPALIGAVVESAAATDRFLWDYRRTIAELIAENHYGTIATTLHSRELNYYGEALESGRPQLGDDLEMRRSTDIPMGAMWAFTPKDGPKNEYLGDLLGAASVAHVYGKNIVGAESLTSMPGHLWSYAPSDLKPVADLEFALGVNRIMIHETALQPVRDKKPGLTLSRYGQSFNRNETWAEEAKPWIDYLSRCSYLLQQGSFVGDLAYFYGEEAPLDVQYPLEQENLPRGYGYDFVNSDIILHQLSVDDGRLVTPGGASYRVLYLGGTSHYMTLPVLQRLLELVRQGATIAGTKPISSPSLSDRTEDFQRVANDLFGAESGITKTLQIGKGRVFVGATAIETLRAVGVPPDWSYSSDNVDADIMFVHRRLTEGDIYFVANRKHRSEKVVVSFPVTGKYPELWFPDSGERKNVSYFTSNGRTALPLHLSPNESLFVLLIKTTEKLRATIPNPIETTLTTLTGSWKISFEEGRGAPKSADFNQLSSWSDSTNPGIRYFSGHAIYEKTILAETKWFHADGNMTRALWLDLGDVKNIAEVSINGKPLPLVWKEPFRVDMTADMIPGSNKLTVRVVNLWVNRLIGDQRPETMEHITFADVQPYSADTPLLPSGLLGPVRIVAVDNPDSRNGQFKSTDP